MTITETKSTAALDDAQLVAESLDGQRDAFRLIVERYKTLICSLAYSATGNMSQSEDVAQETFISAWKDLRHLREPGKLRSWLCGIVRNRAQRSVRDEGREPSCNAVSLDDANESPASEDLPSVQAVSREEEAILWRSLERIPENYREPLVLFYREHKSIERLAAELELSEDAVKQRLSRGRKLLQQEVQSFVEDTLRRTAPGQAFSAEVLAALPLATGTAASAGISLGAKSKAVALSGLLAAWTVPLLGILAGFAAQWAMFYGGSTKRERLTSRISLIGAWVVVLVLSFGGQRVMRLLGSRLGWDDRTFFGAMAVFWWLYAMALATWVILVYRWNQPGSPAGAEVGGMRTQATSPMKPGTRMLAAIGTNLMLFTCVLFLAWSAHDRVAAGAIVVTMLTLSAWHFILSRGKTGPALVVSYLGQLASSCAVMLAIFDLRFDVWAAAWRGVSVAEIHRLLPLSLLPILTLALGLWVAVFLILTRRRPALR